MNLIIIINAINLPEGSVYSVVAITVERFTTLKGHDKVVKLFFILLLNSFLYLEVEGKISDNFYHHFLNSLQFCEIF